MDIVERLRKLEHAGQPIPTAEDAADEIERLRVELVESGEMLFNQANTIHEMQAERDALKQDAERYRCLRDPDCDQWSLPIMFSGDELDREIDRAMPLAGKE